MQMSWRSRYPGPRRFIPRRQRSKEHLELEFERGERERSYRDLDTISRLPGQFRPLLRAVIELAKKEPGANSHTSRLRLVELGAGTGLVGIRLAKELQGAGRQVDLFSTDLFPDFLPAASQSRALSVLPMKLDALKDPIPQADISVANLLIHHFDWSDAVLLLSRMNEASRLGVVVFDLDRNFLAFSFLRFFFPLWVRSPMTVADALISVQQAFSSSELEDLAVQAGIKGARVKRFWRMRNLLWWQKT